MAPTRRAFTLVELLVVIGIIGLLISITLPGLSGARLAASRVKAQANARSVAQAFGMFGEKHGRYPFVGQGFRAPGIPEQAPDPPPGVVMAPWWPRGTMVGVSGHWSHAFMWPGILADVAPWPDHYATWVSPGRETALPEEIPDMAHGGVEATVSFRYSNSFVARPTLWKEGTALEAGLLAPVTPTEVAYPSSKAVAWDAELAYLRRAPAIVHGHYDAPTAVAFVDQHADLKNPKDAAPGFANPLNAGDSRTLHNTPEGALGRDF